MDRTAQQAVPETHSLTVEGESLALRWLAPAPGAATVLYLHGFGSSQDGEKATFFRARAGEAGLGFCSLDFRGHGLSGGSLGEVTFSRNLADVEAVVDWLGERGIGHAADGASTAPLVFFGSSMGGAVALWLAARQPRAFAAGLAIAPALGMAASLEQRLGPGGMRQWRETGRLRFVNDLVDDELGWGLMDDLSRYRAADLAPLVATPTLLFQGMADESVDWRGAVELAREAAQGAVEVHLFAAGDHRLLDLRPRIWRMALSFLNDMGLHRQVAAS